MIMASCPITSWEIDGETVETVSDFIWGGSKITTIGDCSCEIKTLAPRKKSYDQPRQHIKKQRHDFANKVHVVKAMVFPAVRYKCESWSIKKAEHQRIDAFELWYGSLQEKTLESPLDCKGIQPVHPKGHQS